MRDTLIILTENELKQIKKDFKNGGVYTDGCFCGYAISNFRDNLYVALEFSCRKSGICDNNYYTVTDVFILEKALDIFDDQTVKMLLYFYKNGEIDLDVYKIDNYRVYMNVDFELIPENVYVIREDIELDEDSLKKVQKKLFKYYKKTYGNYSDVKFKDIGLFKY